MSTPAWRPVGSVKGPQGPPGLSIEVIPFSMQGSLRVTDSVGRFPIKGGSYRIASIGVTVEDAPLGDPIILDVRANGTSIYTDPDARPRIEPGTVTAVVGAHDPVVLTDGDYLNCDVVQVGSILPGTFLTAAIRLWRGGRDTSG
jgi:hypothetical protein